jgi:virulence-associated protein VagC
MTAPARRTAKLFWNGRSQAVRIPQEFRFEGREVAIRKVGQSVILEALPTSWPRGYFERLKRRRAKPLGFRRPPDPPPSPIGWDPDE